MKVFGYVIKAIFYFGFGFALVFYFGPRLIHHSISPIKQEIFMGEVEQFKIEYVYRNEINYVKLYIRINKTYIKQIFHNVNKDYNNLKNLLCEKNILDYEKPPCRITSNNLPINLNSNQLDSLGTVKYVLDKNNNFTFLEIDGNKIIGNKTGILSRILKFIIGVIVLVFGILGIISFTYVLIVNLRKYNDTGHLPDLPNSIDDAIEGWRSILKKPKS
jgi:hypothetical protein